jgi:predicted nucleic acid-binding protein
MVTNKIFFDTNIIIDILDFDRINHKKAISIWESLVMKDGEIFISEDMLSTIFYINKDNKENTLDFFKLIQNRWNIVSFGKEVIIDAINLSLEKNLDLEDVLQCLCAKENDCNIFLTNDKKFYDCGIKIMTTKECLEYLSDN